MRCWYVWLGVGTEVETDVPPLKHHLLQLLHSSNLPYTHAALDDTLHAACRWAASELHTVAAVMGGVAAQEAIKLLVGQMIPLQDTLVYRAYGQQSFGVYRL